MIQLKIVKAFLQRSRVKFFPNRAKFIVANRGLDLRSADQSSGSTSQHAQQQPLAGLKKILLRIYWRSRRARWPLLQQNKHVVSATLLRWLALQYSDDDPFGSVFYPETVSHFVGI